MEFAVQALQLQRGGADPWLRQGNTLLALHRLADRGLLSVADQGALTAAYVLLREVEHRVQIHRNLQRSTLPTSERDQRVLARATGFRDPAHRKEAEALQAALDQHREAVRAIYDGVLSRLAQAPLAEAPAPDPFVDSMPEAAIVQTLSACGIADAAGLMGSVKAIARLLSSHAPRPEVARLFRRLSPAILKSLAEVDNPVRALRALERYLASLALSREPFAGFLHRPELIAPLIALFGGSQPLSAILISQPELVLQEGFGLEITPGAIHARAPGPPARAPLLLPHAGGGQCVAARLPPGTQLLYIGLNDLSRKAGPAQVCRAQSDLAEACVQAALESCARQAGWPVEPPGGVTGFAVMGLGRLGTASWIMAPTWIWCSSMTTLAPRRERRTRARRRWRARCWNRSRRSRARVRSRRRCEAAALRRRRRPGQFPSIAWMESLDRTAAVWELQSWLKARPVAGDPHLCARLAERIEPALCTAAARSNLEGAVAEMKTRVETESLNRSAGTTDIKLGAGGLNAIQFAIQYLQLRHAVPSPTLKRTTRLLATLRAAGLLEEETHRALHTGFHFLRRLEHQLRLIHGRSLSRLPGSPETMDEIARALDFAGAKAAKIGSGSQQTSECRRKQRAPARYQARSSIS